MTLIAYDFPSGYVESEESILKLRKKSTKNIERYLQDILASLESEGRRLLVENVSLQKYKEQLGLASAVKADHSTDGCFPLFRNHFIISLWYNVRRVFVGGLRRRRAANAAGEDGVVREELSGILRKDITVQKLQAFGKKRATVESMLSRLESQVKDWKSSTHVFSNMRTTVPDDVHGGTKLVNGIAALGLLEKRCVEIQILLQKQAVMEANILEILAGPNAN